MTPSNRRTLWIAFAGLALFIVLIGAMNLFILEGEKRHHRRTNNVYVPLMESIMSMDGSIRGMLAAARGYTSSSDQQFRSQYDEAVRDFERTAAAAAPLAREKSHRQLVEGMRIHFQELKELCDDQIAQTERGEREAAIITMVEAGRRHSSAYDFAGSFYERERVQRAERLAELDGRRFALILFVTGTSALILLFAGAGVSRLARSIRSSVTRQVRRTESMIAGMADGVMLVNSEGRVEFINPAGIQMLGTARLDVPFEEQPDVYGFQTPGGVPMQPEQIPAAIALSTGVPVKEDSVLIGRNDEKKTTVSMSAVPIKEDGVVTGVILSFRDVTERRRLEEETHVQAERAQILADAGAFFASNIDPVWVTQAIVERVAEVLGDWAAIILKTPESSELKVTAIHHRDTASLGLAWSFIYRQPLVAGEGLFGQVVSSGYPSLTSNILPTPGTDSPPGAPPVPNSAMASLLVLPLRTRQEIIGVLVIAANEAERKMNDQKLPLAELLAERAALAIENARLYTEQVEARRKVEDLSRLKDEFLSIASHELRTPVTSIKGYTQLAKALIHEEDLSTSEEYLDIALDQIERMSRLILELLDISRIETGKLEIRRENIDWTDFVSNVVKRRETAANDRKFLLDAPAEGFHVEGDRDRLEQVLSNLLDNAVKYSPEGTEVNVRIIQEQDSLITAVCDHGIGIPPDEIGQVFERFHRGRHVSAANYGGLGLGLYITRQIVERHDGNIWVESRENEGTCFYFSLPKKQVSLPEVAVEATRRA